MYGGMMFYKKNNKGYKTLAEGVKIKTLVYGDKTHLTEFQLKKGASVVAHSHSHEQTGYLVSGRMRLVIGEETYEVEPGDSWSIPGNVEHSGEILSDSIAVEVFSPLREDYLPGNES